MRVADATPERAGVTDRAPPPPQYGLTMLGGGLSLVFGAILWLAHGATQALVFVLGLGLGVSLYHARFGFTSAFRQFVAVGQGQTLRAHMLMLAVASLLFALLLAGGVGAFGTPLSGYVSPLGLGVAVGGFIFGLGMQLGGSCASGTLYTVGAGQSSILITLLGFIVGSVLAAWQWDFWAQPSLNWRAVSLAEWPWGYSGALLLQLAIFAVIVLASYAIERWLKPPPRRRPPHVAGWPRVLRGAWPLWAGALALAGLNALTLWISGKPWGITSAFALWGSKAMEGAGVAVQDWTYWSQVHTGELAKPILADRTSVMDIGIILGAMTATSLAGGLRFTTHIPWRTVAARIVGGVLMGYGARIAHGCNIGAYFGGIASFSLHGWLWGIVALAGTWLGLRVRPLLGLSVPSLRDSSC